MITRLFKKIGTILNYFFTGFSFLASKKIIALLEVLIFIALLNVSMGVPEKIKEKNENINYEKSETTIKTYRDTPILLESSVEGALSELVQCYQNEVKPENYNAELQNSIKSLEDLFNEKKEHFSFVYKDLYSGFTVSYNEEGAIFTASSIKAPAMIYLYEMASLGKIDLNEELTYTSNFYHGGSGVLQKMPQNTKYTVGKLIEYVVTESDNIAYTMLMTRFNRQDMLSFWSEKGTKNIFTLDTIWGVTSAHDVSIYMSELYRFYKTNQEYGKALMSHFKNSKWKMVHDKNGNFNTASKGGWSGTAIHDMAIVFDKNPYIFAVLSNTGESNYTYLFKNASILAGKLHETYWKLKENLCSQIKQY